MLNIYKHYNSSSMHCSFFVMRGISNIKCGSLNNMRCSFLIMRSRSCKWCSSLIIIVVHLLSVALLFLLCKVGITLFAVDHPLFAVVKLLCAADIFFQLNTTLTPVDMEWRDSSQFIVQTSHFTVHTSHFTVQTSYFTVQTSHFTVYTSHLYFTVQTSYFTDQTSQFIRHTSHFTVNSSQFRLHSSKFRFHT